MPLALRHCSKCDLNPTTTRREPKSHIFGPGSEPAMPAWAKFVPTQGGMVYMTYLLHLRKWGPTGRTDWLRHPLKKGFAGAPCTQKKPKKVTFSWRPSQVFGPCAHTEAEWVHSLSGPLWKVRALAAHRLAPPPPQKGLCWAPCAQTPKDHFFGGPSRVYGPCCPHRGVMVAYGLSGPLGK